MTGDKAVIKATEMAKFYKGTICTIDTIQHTGGCILFRLKHKDSYSWYGRNGFKLVKEATS